jgi:Right handed beta helix region
MSVTAQSTLARSCALAFFLLTLPRVSSAQFKAVTEEVSQPGRRIFRVDGVNYPRTDSGLQNALNELQGSCGSVILPANTSIEIAVSITIPSCSGGLNVLSGSGEMTVLRFTTPSARIVQSSGTVVKNLKIVSMQTTVAAGGEIFSQGTTNVEATGLTFSGGGSHITYKSVSNFTISNTRHLSLTAQGNAILLQGSDHGSIVDTDVEGFVAPASDGYYGGAIRVGNDSSHITIVNPTISDIDGTTVRDYAGVDISASHYVSILGGVLTGLKNGDGVVTEDGATDINISGTISTGNSNTAGAGSYGHNGDGFDIYNSARVNLSNCVGNDNGHLASNLQRGAEIYTSEDVTVSNCEFDDNGAEGVIVTGSPRTQLSNVTANGNRMAGVYFLRASGTVQVSGADVSLTDGIGFGLAWEPGTVIEIHSSQCKIASVTDGSHLVLTEPVGSAKSVTYAVESYEASLSSGTYDDNGSGGNNSGRGQTSDGIYLADATTASISNVTATDERSSGKTQMWGAEVQNQARAVFFHDDFVGNAAGEIQDAVGLSERFDRVQQDVPARCCAPRKPE